MLLTPRQVAQKLAVSTRTVYLWLEDGRLPSVRLSERVTRVPAAAVDQLIAASTRPAAHGPGSPECVHAAEAAAVYAPAPARRAARDVASDHSLRLRMLLQAHREEIVRIVESNNAGNTRVFGSVARGTATTDSDIDLVVTAGPEMSMFDLGAINYELGLLLGVAVDVVTENSLRAQIRNKVLSEAVPL